VTELQQLLQTVAGLLIIIGYFPYIRAIFRRETRPSKSTWIVWTVLTWLTAAAMYKEGTLNAQITIIALGDLVVVALAFRHGAPEWNRLDFGCLAGAALGICAWVWTNNPLFGIVIGLSVIVVGSIPTIVKTWNYPDQENPTSYALMVCSCVVTIIAIPAWTVANYAQPIVYFIVAGLILLLTQRPRLKKILRV